MSNASKTESESPLVESAGPQLIGFACHPNFEPSLARLGPPLAAVIAPLRASSDPPAIRELILLRRHATPIFAEASLQVCVTTSESVEFCV